MYPPEEQPKSQTRRTVILIIVSAIGALGVFGYAVWSLFLRFLLPRSQYEPSTVNTIGKLEDFKFGIETKFLKQYRIYVVRNTERLFVMYARCTHLGCTPDWNPGENRFKCPCHGSSFCLGSEFDKEGMNCAGPAQRPMDRAKVELLANGQIRVDTSRLYEWKKGERNVFDEPDAYLKVEKS